MIASIPSPGSGSLEIGPLTLRAYGLMIALGVLAAAWLLAKRIAERGGNPDDATAYAMWAVPAGLVGARAYHVITDWRSFEGRWGDAFKIWEGGLGIPGAVIAGAAATYLLARRKGHPYPTFLDTAAPILPLAQALGRLGNWWNQELYGKPTDLPWGLEIDPENRVSGYAEETTFHPTFLYESLWNFALVGVLIRVDRMRVLKPGRLFAVYTGGYAAGRLWIEAIRIDFASQLGGVRVNIWVMSVVLAVSLVLIFTGIERQPDGDADEDAGDAGPDDDAGDAGPDDDAGEATDLGDTPAAEGSGAAAEPAESP